MKLQPIEQNGIIVGHFYSCPGCKIGHALYITDQQDPPIKPVWEFNGDTDKPTFKPSVLSHYKYGAGSDLFELRCHSYITDGKIIYLADCSHQLAGQTINIPDLDK